MSIQNKVVLITGGSKGIGYGIAETLLKEQAKVAITSRSLEAAETAARKLKDIGDILPLMAQEAAGL